jgi:small subunit ribosomal protein S16
MKMAEPKANKLDLFNAALADATGEPEAEATTPRKRAAKATKAAEPKAAEPKAVEPKAVEPKAEAAAPAAADESTES